MSDDEAERVSRLIEAVADGTIDSDEFATSATQGSLSELMAELRVLSAVASVHRSQVLEEIEQQSLEGLAVSVPDPRASPTGGFRRWGNFALLRALGEGAFGEVYLAQHLLLNHQVALKLLKPHVMDSLRILNEAKALARVRQPNVVTVHGVDIHDGRIGFWMDYVDGVTLADVLRSEGVRSIDEATAWAKDLCRAVGAVHAAGIIHRDIKAENVIRHRHDGRLVLMDFGSGQLADVQTGTRQLAEGTPVYLAPELLDGGSATQASDVYALGVLLFYVVTKRYPVEATSWEDLVEAHRQERRTRLEDLRPDVAPAFAGVVRQMLAPDPLHRFRSVGAVSEALDEPSLRSGRQITPRRITGAVGIALLSLSTTGYACSMLYNSPLRLTGGFENESPLVWPLWGLRALVASGIVMAGLSLAVLVVRQSWKAIGSATGLQLGLNTPFRAFRSKMYASQASVVFTVMSAQLAVGGLSVWAFQDVLRGLDSFISQRPPIDFSALSPARQARQIWFGLAVCTQVMLFGSAWFRVCRGSWRSASADARGLMLGGIILTIVTFFAGQILPYRILYHNRSERVTHQSQRCYLVGRRGDDARLFCPTRPPWVRAVSLTDPAVVREGVFENIFVGLEKPGPVQ